jgi:hypothetical protein
MTSPELNASLHKLQELGESHDWDWIKMEVANGK